MNERIKGMIKLAEKEKQLPNAFFYLPEIIETLETALKSLEEQTLDFEKRKIFAKGLGRLITESNEFAESPLGTLLLGFTSDLRRTNQEDTQFD